MQIKFQIWKSIAKDLLMIFFWIVFILIALYGLTFAFVGFTNAYIDGHCAHGGYQTDNYTFSCKERHDR
jgi:hypothetical protein